MSALMLAHLAWEAYGSVFNQQLSTAALQALVREVSHEMTLIRHCQKPAGIIIFKTVHLKRGVLKEYLSNSLLTFKAPDLQCVAIK